MGKPRKTNVLNPETRGTIQSPHQTPSPTDYQVPSDNYRFIKKNTIAYNVVPKFFTPKNMPSIKSAVPIQYTGLDGVSPIRDTNLNAANRSSSLSGYTGGIETSKYRQVDFGGKSKRFDFTMANVKDKGDFIYDFEKIGSVKEQLLRNKRKGTLKSTFGTAHAQNEKAVVKTGLAHYLGKG